MGLSFEQELIEVWRQALVGNAKAVELGSERYPVHRTPAQDSEQTNYAGQRQRVEALFYETLSSASL